MVDKKKHAENSSRWRQRNPKKARAAERRWRLKNPGKRRAIDKARALAKNLKRYGLTPQMYESLLAKQGNVCAICRGGNDRTGRRLAVDHNHETGRVRGLLCNRCNRAIGMFKDDYTLVRLAAEYLLRPTVHQ